MDKNSFLKSLPIFKNLPSNEMENISRMFMEDNYDKD